MHTHQPDVTPSTGSRRRRLWELPRAFHCALIGICLPQDILRRLADKAGSKQVFTDDYELHTSAVSACSSRNRWSELLQRELDQRHALVFQFFKQAKSTAALATLWQAAVAKGEVTAAFWAG